VCTSFYTLHHEKYPEILSENSRFRSIQVSLYTVRQFQCGNLRELYHLEDPGVDGRITFSKWDVGVWAGSSWLRIGAGGGHL